MVQKNWEDKYTRNTQECEKLLANGNGNVYDAHLRSALHPLDFWALKAHMDYGPEDMKEKIGAHCEGMKNNIKIGESEIKITEDKIKKMISAFNEGLQYVSDRLPAAYHGALLGAIEAQSRRNYVSRELQKIVD